MRVIFLIGVSGAGKSTYRNNFLKDNHNFLLINRDNIRKTLFGDDFYLNDYYKSKHLNNKENLVSSIQDSIIQLSILREKDLFVDNTNLKELDINSITSKLPDTNNIEFIFIEAEGGIEINKQRVLNRDFNKDKTIDLSYIDKQYLLYQYMFNRIKNLGIKYQIIKT